MVETAMIPGFARPLPRRESRLVRGEYGRGLSLADEYRTMCDEELDRGKALHKAKMDEKYKRASDEDIVDI